MIEYGAPSCPVGHVAGCSPVQPIFCSSKLPAGADDARPERHRGGDDDEKEEALQSHRRAKVADLSDGATTC